jgi:Rieske Fe-S protein
VRRHPALPSPGGELFGQALGAVGAATLGIAGISAVTKGSYQAPQRTLGSKGSGGTAAGTGSTARKASAAHTSKVPSGAVRLGPADSLPPGQGATYSDPADGSPDLIIRQANGELTAMSAVCTNAGCTVGYQDGQVICPCHGATYDSRSGAVTGGPAPQGLARKRVVESGGQINAVPN